MVVTLLPNESFSESCQITETFILINYSGFSVAKQTYLLAISAAALISLKSPDIFATPKHPISNPMMH